MKLWGIDLGGTKIEGAIIEPGPPVRAMHRLRVPTESDAGYGRILENLSRLVEWLERESCMLRPERIGVGTPGTFDRQVGAMRNCNTTCLNGRNLPADLEEALGVKVCVANDANCFALAEATLGSAVGEEVVMGLILGSGVGSGLVVRGQLWEGIHGIAGEWGHNPMRNEDSPCYCGRRGCVETVISGKALERWFFENGGEAMTLPEIVLAAERGHVLAGATMERLRQKFAEAIAVVINIVDPSAIVIGGGVGNIDLLYSERTRREILNHTFHSEVYTKILKPALGDSAGVFGAAMLTASSK